MKTQEEVARQHAVGPINIYKIYQEGYQDRELDDWESFRREAAKDILSALCSFRPISNYKDDVRQAINIADELIKQLKEGKK